MRRRLCATIFGCCVLPVVAGGMSAGEFGEWRLEFEDGTHLAASDWKTNAAPAWSYAETKDGPGVRRAWKSPDVDVTVTESRLADGAVDRQLTLANRGKTVAGCDFPARLRFQPDSVKRFVYPGRGNFGVGMAFNAKFFKPTGDKKRPYLSYRVKYPTLFADFALLETSDGGRMSVYGLQPREPHEPWKNPVPFNPGVTAVGGDAKGGWYDHTFAAWVKAGGTWTSPKVRLRTGATLEAALADYLAANRLTRTLEEKVGDAAKLRRLKEAPLLLLHGGTVDSLKAALPDIPVPTLIHVANYLKGGFDKEYPDHLPPSEWFGTMDGFRDLVRAMQARGHLFCPYTNPTWWCDKPRGPTFKKWGMDAIAIERNGKPRHENYGPNEGWQQTYFHPGSHEGNRRTVRQFTKDIPVDMLFEDQCGGRDWIWDFNPASPSPTAHSEGMLSLVEEHARSVPLATEDGWDQLANSEVALMGCTWRIVPFTDGSAPHYLKLFKEEFPADTWEIEAVSLRLFHDKCLFYMHNLCNGASGEIEVPWLLGLGFQFSGSWLLANYRNNAVGRQWYSYLHLLQSKVVSRIAGQPLVSFRHDRAPLLARGGNLARVTDDGTIEAQYGDVKVLANLGDVPRTVGGKRLAPYGYHVEAPGLLAAKLEGKDPFVRTGGREWVFETVEANPAPAVELPKKAPVCGGGRPVVGIVDVQGFYLAQSTVSPDEWEKTLAASALGVHGRAKIVRLRSAEEIQDALAGGPSKAFAIINPYGELFPVTGPGRWRAMLDALRDYVRAGGNWVETGGAAFTAARWRNENGKMQHERLRGNAMGILGLSFLPFGPLPDSKQPVCLSSDGQRWFSAEVRGLFASERKTPVNRGVGGAPDPVLPLIVNDRGHVWFGGNRLGGIGMLWRTGGSEPDAQLLKSVVPDVLLHQWLIPPEPIPTAKSSRLISVPPTQIE